MGHGGLLTLEDLNSKVESVQFTLAPLCSQGSTVPCLAPRGPKCCVDRSSFTTEEQRQGVLKTL